MVLLASAICTKSGKALVSRQFVEMTKARIEGLLAAFPKLVGSGKQHTFVETESVRYVYQPMEKLYMLLITTKASNILEDLETLRLFSRVIPEFCRTMEEHEIMNHAFELIFAFDEIVALGYRENVNLAQIRTYTEMDSHEERVAVAIRQSQEKEAKRRMKERAKELDRQRRDAIKTGRAPGFGGGMGGYGMSPSPVVGDSVADPVPTTQSKPFSAPSRSSGPSKAMKLGSKRGDVDNFVDRLKSEGQDVTANDKAKPSAQAKAQATPAANTESVHIRSEEKIILSASRDGGLQQMEVHGLMTLHISDDQYGRIKIQLNSPPDKNVQLQTHPNVDKKLFSASHQVALKNPQKPFPLKSDVGVLKWRLQTNDESLMPLSINCWPEDSGQGCEVNIEYELENADLELNDVLIRIPLPTGCSPPVVAQCEGEYYHNRAHSALDWKLALIDASNKSGSLEFTVNTGVADAFFPVHVEFISKKTFCDIKPLDVLLFDSDTPVKHSIDTLFFAEKYEIM